MFPLNLVSRNFAQAREEEEQLCLLISSPMCRLLPHPTARWPTGQLSSFLVFGGTMRDPSMIMFSCNNTKRKKRRKKEPKHMKAPFSRHLPCHSSLSSLGDGAVELFCKLPYLAEGEVRFLPLMTVVSRIRPKSDKVGTKILLRENLFRGLSVPPAVQLWK